MCNSVLRINYSMVYAGRCYLCQHPDLLQLLNSEKSFKEEDDTMRNILGALQKLSLR